MSRVAYIIQQLLAREGKTFLPNFGVLTLQRKAAVIDSAQQQIQPPTDSLHFMASEFILKQHLTAQLQKLPFSKKTNIEQLAEEVESFIQSAKKKDEFSIGNFAYFTKTESGEFNFQAKNVAAISPLGKLPTIQLLVPVATQTVRDAAAIEAVRSTQEEEQQEKEKKNSWIIPTVLTLLILLISVGIWWFTPELRNGGEGFSKLLVKEERVNVSPSEVENKELSEPPMEMDTTQNTDTSIHENEVQGQMATPSDTVASNEKRESTTEEQPLGTERTEEIEAEDNCVIVVGAFSKSYNVDRMKERLQNEGYDVFTQNANGLTRVGLYTSCVNEKLDSVLQVARNDIEQAAWILE